MDLDHLLVTLLAGSAGERLYPLTRESAKPAVYVGASPVNPAPLDFHLYDHHPYSRS